jgi:hypothetical protein
MLYTPISFSVFQMDIFKEEVPNRIWQLLYIKTYKNKQRIYTPE